MFKKCLENRIIRHEGDYRCYLCHCEIKQSFDLVLEHLATDNHVESLNQVDECQRKNECESLAEMSESQLRVIVENQITFDRCFVSSFYCHACMCRVGEIYNTFAHIREGSHISASNQFVAQYKLEANKILCDNNGTQANIISDANIQCRQELLDKTKNNLELKDTENESQESANQYIIQAQNTLQTTKVENYNKSDLQEKPLESSFSERCYCVTCKTFLRNNVDVQYHVMLHLFKEFQLLNNFDILELKFGADGKSYLKCLLCDFYCLCEMSDIHEFLREHLKTETHLKRLTFFKDNKNDLSMEVTDEQINSIDLKKFTYSTDHSLLCNTCDVTLLCSESGPDQHALEKYHNKRLQEIQFGAVIGKKAGFQAINYHYYQCFACNTSFPNASMLLDHYKTSEHKWKIKGLKMIKECSYTKFKRSNDTQIIDCSLCNIIFNDLKLTVEHIMVKDHNEKLMLVNKNTDVASLVEPMKAMNSSINSEKLSEKKKTKAKAAKNAKPAITTKKIQGIEKFEANVEELNQLGFGTENIQPLSMLNPDMADEPLGDLVSLDFNNSQTENLPSQAETKRLCTAKVEDTRNTFTKNVLLNGKTLVKYCIDPGQDNIYNVDNKKLSLFKSGVSLTIPNCFDRVCIPCREQFPNAGQSLFEHLQNAEHLKNICNLQVYDKEFENAPQKFSDLKLAKLYMQVSDQSIQCHVCNIKLEDDYNVIRQHAKSSIHKEKSKVWKEESEQLFEQYLTIFKDVWYYAEVFFCEICKIRCEFEIDFAIHLIHPEHMKKVYELKRKKAILKFDVCFPCTTYWFGKADSYEKHCKRIHNSFANNKDFMGPELNVSASEFLANIDENADLLVIESDKEDLEINRETALFKAIVDTVKPVYPNAEAYVFGSRLSRLGLSESDVDVFLDCENVYYKISTRKDSQKYMSAVKSYFRSAPNSWAVDKIVFHARVPIMKLRHIPTNLNCDVSFVNGLSVEKSRLVGIYNRAFPVCRKLILFVKKWLARCRAFGSDYIMTTFAISWCVIFYFQSQGILPSVHELIERRMDSKVVDGWECGFEEISTCAISNFSFKEHLKGFFIYFANFDYQKNVVCPYLGKAIGKHMFAFIDELPPQMDIYKRRLQDNELDIFRFDSPMCIQDPIDLRQNLTKAVKKQQLRSFRQYCILSAEKC